MKLQSLFSRCVIQQYKSSFIDTDIYVLHTPLFERRLTSWRYRRTGSLILPPTYLNSVPVNGNFIFILYANYYHSLFKWVFDVIILDPANYMYEIVPVRRRLIILIGGNIVHTNDNIAWQCNIQGLKIDIWLRISPDWPDRWWAIIGHSISLAYHLYPE